MKIIITGSIGLIGSHLLRELTKYYSDVSALRRAGSSPKISLDRDPIWIEGQLNDLSESTLKGSDCLIHLAAHGVDPKAANWDDCFRCNVIESVELWRRAANAGVKNFVICGSCFEYGATGDSCEYISLNTPLRPTGPYHASKAAATMAASALAYTEKVKVWVLRPFHIFGEGESANRLYPQILKAAREGRDLDLTEGRQVRDFMNAQDAARMIHGYALMLSEESPEPVFRISNLGTGKPTSLRDFTAKVWKENGGTGALNFGAIPYRDAEVMRYVPEINQAEQGAAANALSRVAELCVLQEMKYPKQYSLGSEPEEIRVGDLVWWNEGTCVGHVRWIWERERDGDYSWADTEGPPIFLSNKHPYQVGTEPEGVIHDESCLEDEGIGPLSEHERGELEWAMSEAKGRVTPEHRDVPFCVSALMDMDRDEEDWHFDFIDEEDRNLETVIIPFRSNTRTNGEHGEGGKASPATS